MMRKAILAFSAIALSVAVMPALAQQKVPVQFAKGG
jgi:CRISPR/Cas system-associated endonuclease Cas1